MLNAIGNGFSHLLWIDDDKDRADTEYDCELTKQGKLNKDNESGWVIVAITEILQLRNISVSIQQIKLDKLTQLGWRDTAQYILHCYAKYGTEQSHVMADVNQQPEQGAAASALTIGGKQPEDLDIIPGKSQMLRLTCHPGSTHIWLGSVKP
jgi:hypothetical protein